MKLGNRSQNFPRDDFHFGNSQFNSAPTSAEFAICKICKLLISMKQVLLFNSSVVTDELDMDLLSSTINSTINSNRTFFMREANTLYV